MCTTACALQAAATSNGPQDVSLQLCKTTNSSLKGSAVVLGHEGNPALLLLPWLQQHCVFHQILAGAESISESMARVSISIVPANCLRIAVAATIITMLK